ncbi:RHS repeat domain-containing protein, partial [Fastidiosibacter lacustris]|uniref:RHS repeat domain-containing protein n=1 Tax=Fastidiosibacter lacustris TaxID=2056695 RepID=UPI0013001B0E
RYTYLNDQHFIPATVQAPYNSSDTVMRYQYDKHGYLHKITNELAHVATIDKRNHDGQVLQSTDENGVITTLTYQDKDNNELPLLPLSVTVNHATTTYGYDEHQHLVSVTTPEQVTLRYQKTAEDVISSITDGANNVLRYDKDVSGELLTTIHDASGQVVYQSPQGTRLRHKVKLTKDLVGNITDVQHDGMKTSYRYNPWGEKTDIDDSIRGQIKLQYNGGGQLVRKEDAKGQRFDYRYDVLNRLTEVRVNQQPLLTYVYDKGNYGKGRLTSLTRWHAASANTLANAYDALGNVLTQTSTINNHSYATSYTYNKDNQITSVTYPSGLQVAYAYNHLGEVSKVSAITKIGSIEQTLADNIKHLPFGPLSSLTFGNGLALKREFDLLYQLTHQSVQNITQTFYDYDNNGYITQVNHTNNPTQNKAYTYDEFNRLKTIESPVIKRSFDYDNSGFLIGENAVEALNSFNKDANGNITQIDSLTLHYDVLNQIERIEENNQLIAEYQYNGYGQRITKVIHGKETVFIYDIEGRLIEIITDNQITDIIYLDGKPLAQITNDEVYYFINDAVGTPNLLFDIKGQIQWQADSQGYEIKETFHNITQNLRFAGQYYDEESGLYYNNARYFHPKLGGYLQPDALDILAGGNVHPYAYASNNPVNVIDPTGLY